jgi:uncharacterized repeat protein (TIGR03803 family)
MFTYPRQKISPHIESVIGDSYGNRTADERVGGSAGNLFGTTQAGGNGACPGGGCGTVFELTPTRGGGWTEKVLHSFNGKDGYLPWGGLTFDAAGNLYGTTANGGNACTNGSCGVVFELTPKADGSWTEKILHKFNGHDGWSPQANLIFDTAGNLYGTTYLGGIGDGTVFELTPEADGRWTEKVLHRFNNTEGRPDGANPSASLVFDGAGNLYGTTAMGGSGYCNDPCGTVFELIRKTGGGWTEKVPHNFTDNGKDGFNPWAGLTLDASGNLYGTTAYGGTGPCMYGCGTVFELTPGADGGWTEKVVHNFNANGNYPYDSVIFDASGNLYGTTGYGGNDACGYGCGAVFELTPKAGGGWTAKILHSFNYQRKDGYFPQGGLIFGTGGNLYGTTTWGGAHSSGTVFEVTP